MSVFQLLCCLAIINKNSGQPGVALALLTLRIELRRLAPLAQLS